MTEPRAILATFSDWRPVKGRKVLQLIFEVPVEQTADVLTKLGAPMPHEDRWCGIALVEQRAELIAPIVQTEKSEPIKIERQKERKRFAEMNAAQQAGMLCDMETSGYGL